MPAIVASAAIVFAISIDDFVISQWLSSGARRDDRADPDLRATRAAPLPSTNAIATIMVLHARSVSRVGFLVYRAFTRGERQRRTRRSPRIRRPAQRAVDDREDVTRDRRRDTTCRALIKRFGERDRGRRHQPRDRRAASSSPCSGPSGCGKTTTLRMIAGFEQPTEGRILLDGADMAYTPPHKRNVNTVFQNYALFPHLNVFDNVAFGLRRAEACRSARSRSGSPRRSSWCSSTGLEKRKPAQLSGGQQQRVALARALVLQPRGAPARRAARRARREAAKGAPDRAEGAAAAGRDHVHLRDPRPGGGAHDVRPASRS